MRLFDDIKSPLLLYLKGGLFGMLAIMAGVLTLFADIGTIRTKPNGAPFFKAKRNWNSKAKRKSSTCNPAITF